MNVRLALITYSHDAHIWRLRLDDADGSPYKLLELPDFSGDMRRTEDVEKINAALATWGVWPSAGGWTARDGGWIVPVIQHAG